MTDQTCIFCNGETRFAYRSGNSDLNSCCQCRTIGVSEFPTSEELASFYDGFSFQTETEKYMRINTPEVRSWMEGIVGTGGEATMLDVGGGGGFFSKAFEEFRLGESTYIDLDEQACQFAETEMGVPRVIHDQVENLHEHVGDKQFDFIYCRHVIEHLVDPVSLIKSCSKLLSPKGTFVLQCPNGMSKEAIFYPRYWNKFLIPTCEANEWSRFKGYRFSLSRSYGWGIDPIRHLWAISEDAIRLLFQNENGFEAKVASASLRDPVFSPYWLPTDRLSKVTSPLAAIMVPNLLCGAHLVAYIKRQN